MDTVLLVVLIAVSVVLVVAAVAAYLLVATGALTLDTGWGRRTRPLGPLSIGIAADRDVVYRLLTQPYLGPSTRALAAKVTVLERGTDLVVAAHRTPIRGRLVAVTVETVRFTPGERINFQLLRGPVPYVVEQFTLTDIDASAGNGCRLDYRGELGTDFGVAGAWWGGIVARRWQAAVDATMRAVRTQAQRPPGTVRVNR